VPPARSSAADAALELLLSLDPSSLACCLAALSSRVDGSIRDVVDQIKHRIEACNKMAQRKGALEKEYQELVQQNMKIDAASIALNAKLSELGAEYEECKKVAYQVGLAHDRLRAKITRHVEGNALMKIADDACNDLDKAKDLAEVVATERARVDAEVEEARRKIEAQQNRKKALDGRLRSALEHERRTEQEMTRITSSKQDRVTALEREAEASELEARRLETKVRVLTSQVSGLTSEIAAFEATETALAQKRAILAVRLDEAGADLRAMQRRCMALEEHVIHSGIFRICA
jgi:chromosome segregation ATPase